jgi:hypothetical protein
MLFIFLDGGNALDFYSVRFSTGTPTILIEVFHDFPQSLEANAGIYSIRPRPLVPKSSVNISHHPIRHYTVLIVKASLNNLRRKQEYVRCQRVSIQTLVSRNSKQ